MTKDPQSVLLLGATGTIGQAVAQVLVQDGYDFVAPTREAHRLQGAVVCDMSQGALTELMRAHGCRAVISCVASRTGVPADADAVDRDLNLRLLGAAVDAGVAQFILLSAICVQKPKLAFQHAKLAFEKALQDAPLTWSIVRPTAYFKSLSGQVDRLRKGKPFLVFGDGRLTACKPISDADLARYLVNCLGDCALHNRILPVGGPGPAITPLEQGHLLFAALGREPKFKHVPVAMISVIGAVLGALGHVSKRARSKSELAKIGHYYATEAMLVWDDTAQHYDAAATPEFGHDTLRDYYVRLAENEVADMRGDHSVF